MVSIKTVIFCDGRPGHEKQTQGVVKALQKYVDIEVETIKVDRVSFWRRPAKYLRLLREVDKDICAGADLLLGTGSQTHVPLLLCKLRGNAKGAICMAPSLLLRRYFDLCFVPVHDQYKKSVNIVETIGPPNALLAGGSHEQNRRLVLIGGMNKALRIWDSEGLVSNIKHLIEKDKDIQWTLATSPRTPAQTETALEELAGRFVNVDFYPFYKTEPGWVEEQYRKNSLTWVTGDSMSMVYEALSAGCDVGLLPVCWNNKNNKFCKSEQYLLENNWIKTFSQWCEGDRSWDKSGALNEADKCAKEILRRWWPESLQ